MNPCWLLILVMMISVMIVSTAALDTGYGYENPVGSPFIEPKVQQVRHPVKHRLKPSTNYCQNGLGNDAKESYRLLSHPPQRRFIQPREVLVDRSFFEPTAERVEQLKRILLDQQ